MLAPTPRCPHHADHTLLAVDRALVPALVDPGLLVYAPCPAVTPRQGSFNCDVPVQKVEIAFKDKAEGDMWMQASRACV